jgi:hypothetical protein
VVADSHFRSPLSSQLFRGLVFVALEQLSATPWANARNQRKMGYKTTPRSYYELFVEPNLRDYLERPDDVRLAFNASLTAFQLRDITYFFYEKNEPSKISRWSDVAAFQVYLVEREPLFQTVQSVATVFKHLHTYEKSYYEIGSPGALWGLATVGADIDLRSDWELVSMGDVLARRKDGTVVSMTAALNAVVYSMWPDVLPDDVDLEYYPDSAM